MDTEDAVNNLQHSLTQIASLRESHAFSPEHVRFVQTTSIELARIFGPDSIITKTFNGIRYEFLGTFIFGYMEYEKEKARHNHEAFLQGLDIAEGILHSAIEQLNRHGADRILTEIRVKAGGARVFVSHGKETPALTKVERFIRALGIEPVIVKRGASEGLAVDDLVEKRMSESDCALILATADEKIDNRKQPRPNVIHEIGLAQEKFDKKVIYLKETDCEFPSNVRPKVWESFTQDNMEAAFEKISKELHAFGFI